MIYVRIPRRAAVAGMDATPGMANVKVTEGFGGQEPSDPVRSTDFNFDGKPLSHALSRQQIFINSAPGVFGAWGRDDFAGTHSPLAMLPHMPPGLQNPAGVRPNIARQTPQAYGSRFSLDHSVYGLG